MPVGDRIIYLDPARVRAELADPAAFEMVQRFLAETERLKAARVNGVTDIKVTLVCGACNKRMVEVVVEVKTGKYLVMEKRRGEWKDRAGPNTTGTADGDVATKDDLIGPRAQRVLLSCPCGAEWPVRKKRLSAAWRAAAAPGGSRRIVIPTDLPPD